MFKNESQFQKLVHFYASLIYTLSADHEPTHLDDPSVDSDGKPYAEIKKYSSCLKDNGDYWAELIIIPAVYDRGTEADLSIYHLPGHTVRTPIEPSTPFLLRFLALKTSLDIEIYARNDMDREKFNMRVKIMTKWSEFGMRRRREAVCN